MRAALVALLACGAGSSGLAADLLAPLVGPQGAPVPPWYFSGLPRQTKPSTRFDAADVDGVRVLRVESDHAYGNLVHPLPPGTPASPLSWRARVDQAVRGADLTRRSGEDTALRVCALFDMPDTRVPFLERQALHMAETHLGEHLPTATLCYVADTTLSPGTLVVSPYTRRLRGIVIATRSDAWTEERRDLSADFLRAFGDESGQQVPPLLAILVGADTDNTGSHSVAHVDALRLLGR